MADYGYSGKTTDSDRHSVEQQLNKLIGLMATRAVGFLIRNERQRLDHSVQCNQPPIVFNQARLRQSFLRH